MLVDLAEIEPIFNIILSLATVVLVVLIWKTISQLEETVKLSRLQTNYRFRPWIGHLKPIESSSKNGRSQCIVTFKNFGELPAADSEVRFAMKTEEIKRDETDKLEFSTFRLGPLLPNMEKQYWFYVDSNLIEKADNNEIKIYVYIQLSYEFAGGKGKYSMISKYDGENKIFLHQDMWTD